LTPFGRQQNFQLGVQSRYLYGRAFRSAAVRSLTWWTDLLNNFTAAGKLPVFRTESEDRMVKTMENFAAGFFGIPYENQFNMELMIEGEGFNNTGASYDVCTVCYCSHNSAEDID
jgi:hypothetical protein